MRIGFVSTRIKGLDGVSLEIPKLAALCRRLGHTVCYCAGELAPALRDAGLEAPAMHFAHPEAKWIHDHSFGRTVAEAGLRERIADMAAELKAVIARFESQFGVDVLFVQNALSIPMHIPLGVALTEHIAETGIPTLAHHHDFAWERDRFALTAIPDVLERCFPPDLPSARHITINSLAQRALRQRKGIESTILPNLFDFATAAPGISDFNADLRAGLGLREDHLLILQPTRVIARKGIEHAIELTRRLREPDNRARLGGREAVLLVTHAAGDEGLDYLAGLQALARSLDVPFVHAADRFAEEAGWRDGRKVYALWDAYVHADFVTYPSLIEGFGNALLETIYFRLPALVQRYPVYAADIAPQGFDFIEIDGAVTDQTVQETIAVLRDPTRRRRMVERNYELARRLYSLEAGMSILASLLKATRA